MESNATILNIAVIDSFMELTRLISKLEHNLCDIDANLPAWFNPPKELILPPNLSIREQIFAFIAQLEFLDLQAPKEILIGPGIVASSNTTIEIINAINTAKEQFKAAMLALKASRPNQNQNLDLTKFFNQILDQQKTDKHRLKTIASALNKMGLARLHLKQCYRKIPIFLRKPEQISWTWANTRAITRISVHTAREKLLRHSSYSNDSGIKMQLAKLEQLPPDEPLAIVQNLAPHLRANISFTSAHDSLMTERIMIKAPMPIFYLTEPNDLLLPQFNPPKNKTKRSSERLVRSDVKLDPEVFLPAIRVHRYLKKHQQSSQQSSPVTLLGETS